MKKTLLLCAALVLAASPSAYAQKKLTTVKVTQAVSSFSFLPLYYAKHAKFYEAEGLDVQQISTRGGGPDLVALISGDVQFNVSAGTYQLGAIRQNRKIKIVYNYYNRNLIQIVLSNKVVEKSGVKPTDSLEKRLAVLKGLRLGFTRAGALTDFQWRHLLRQAKLGPDDAKLVAIGGGAALLAAMEREQIDAYAISPPIDLMGVDRGLGVLWINNAKGDDPSMDPFDFQSVVVQEEYAKKNPEIVKAFIRATRKAVNEIIAKSPEEVFKVVQSDFRKLDPKIAIAAIKEVKPAFNKKGDMTLAQAKNVIKMSGVTDVKAEQLHALYTPAYQ